MGLNQKGFTLAEVLIGLTLIATTVVSVTSLTISSIRANQANLNRLVAFNLAQEGVEIIRNVRDSNWTQNLDWKGNKNLKTGSQLEDGFYKVELNLNFPKVGDLGFAFNRQNFRTTAMVSMEQKSLVPWVLTKITKKEKDQTGTALFLKESPFIRGNSFYGHDLRGETTAFSRYVQVESKETDYDEKENKINKILVTSVVFWDEDGKTKKLDLKTELTDWKQSSI